MNLCYWEIIADEIKQAGWSVGSAPWVGNALLWSVDASKHDGRRFIAQAEELAVAMLELQKMLRGAPTAGKWGRPRSSEE